MTIRPPRRRWPRRSVAVLLTAIVGSTLGTLAADAGQSDAVTAWARRHASPVATDPFAGLDDLQPLRASIGEAVIVGLGESDHGAAEETELKFRTLRMLVEQLGFRAVAWEEDWTTGVEINAYIQGGDGDLSELMMAVSPQYQKREVADVLAWLRAFNTGRSDPVSFVGVEYYFTRRLAYDTVESYVATMAPERLDELRRHLTPLRPTSDDPFEHIGAYAAVEDKQPYLDHAHAVYDLVVGAPAGSEEHDRAIAVHSARQIVSFYEHYAMPETDNVNYRETRAAESIRWWRDLTGEDIVYWAASPHTANAPDLRIVRPGSPDMRFASAGSHLRRWYADGYRSIGYTLDHGRVATGSGETAEVPPPAPEWFEAPLGAVDLPAFVLDLRGRVPTPVRRWLTEPVITRGLDPAPGSVIDGGTLREWFDVIVHTQIVRPATVIATMRSG